MKAQSIVRPTTVSKLRRGGYELALRLGIEGDASLDTRITAAAHYDLYVAVSEACAHLRNYPRVTDEHVEAWAEAHVARAAAATFLGYESPYASDHRWPYSAESFNRDCVLPRYFTWDTYSGATISYWTQESFPTTTPLADAAPRLVRELAKAFVVERIVAVKRSRSS